MTEDNFPFKEDIYPIPGFVFDLEEYEAWYYQNYLVPRTRAINEQNKMNFEEE